ncbi:alpha/beta fold hydrolase [Tessaracoccus sp. OS52]|uniref:alpha/beta hydrolase n=1 Tax=Tessaracoccus sp. OS52 TaxID=2886691 RepID=UPI001D1045A6|nr:alpha/beta fold hydrolase [Tessaracoccus sp. OS52]MCC2593421.1 alpha/beta fold hydrolase [Tessaracoccus sp. OS52]
MSAPVQHVWPEADTLRLGEGDIGVVVCHGFTGCVQSVAGWAKAIAERTPARVIAPRLRGHGTVWTDMHEVVWTEWLEDVDAAYRELAEECSQVFVAGLSMGGALALRLAQTRDVAGVLLVNPGIASRNPLLELSGVIRYLVRSQPGIASDIAKPDVEETGYTRVSVPAVWTMTRLWAKVRADLDKVSAPVVLFRSDVDHVVDDSSHRRILAALPGTRLVPLPNSYHVATLDHDAETIHRESVKFIRRHAR